MTREHSGWLEPSEFCLKGAYSESGTTAQTPIGLASATSTHRLPMVREHSGWKPDRQSRIALGWRGRKLAYFSQELKLPTILTQSSFNEAENGILRGNVRDLLPRPLCGVEIYVVRSPINFRSCSGLRLLRAQCLT